eukprot:TRINITY_DN102820_c0_g1_i1.p1 TRINITY_DN102820_c0_g1~~TRINITY_DN102820_c0_g1_i1.p1  ORF type:complete len:1190 (-),score=140.29 TRINITY_DN102820_c0_g1_i1:71-3640(-)
MEVPRQTFAWNTNDADMDHGESSLRRRAVREDVMPDAQVREMLRYDSETDVLELHSLDDWQIEPELVQPAKLAWKEFREKSSSNLREEGVELFQVIFKSTPGIQQIFEEPMFSQSFKFMMAVSQLVQSLDDPPSFRHEIETLGFQHVNIEMIQLNVKAFRLALVMQIQKSIGLLSDQAREGLAHVIDYTGAAVIFIRKSSEERIEMLMDSWAEAHAQDEVAEEDDDDDASGSDDGEIPLDEGRTFESQDSGQIEKAFDDTFGDAEGESTYDENDSDAGSDASGDRPRTKKGHAEHKAQASAHIPQNFDDMFEINAAVMGFQKAAKGWMSEVLATIEAIVSHLTNTRRSQEECAVLVLRLYFYDHSTIVLQQFKACLLAALRSTLPKTWSTKHEEAWTWLWDSLVRILEATMYKPEVYDNVLWTFMESMGPKKMYRMRTAIYNSLFTLAPDGQKYFKQSNTRLHFIAERVLLMTTEIFSDPHGMISQISALGLRHVGFGIPVDLFNPFLTAYAQVISSYAKSHEVDEAFQWSLMLISKILTRTITEGSTPVMTAIHANSGQFLAKALTAAPRGKRATQLLHIQVGDQFISPLMWAIESGSLQVAEAMIQDLLTIRADRRRYYFGSSELFQRHPHIVITLADKSPKLLQTLLDGLIWRSHRTTPDGLKRRVNYFVKHLLLNQKGKFSDGLRSIAGTGDPALVTNPIVVLLVDTLWVGIVRRVFMISRLINVVSLIVFISSQNVIEEVIRSNGATLPLRIALVVARICMYVLGIIRVGFVQLSRIYIWARNTFERILNEIDTDGNGEIEWDEMKEALSRLLRLAKNEARKAVGLPTDQSGSNAADGQTAGGSKQSQLYHRASFALMSLLCAMLTHEPMILCSSSEEWPTAECEEYTADTKYRYCLFSMLAGIVHFLMLVDLSVLSTDLSAFLLVVGAVLAELTQFLSALSFLLFLFGSTVSIHCRTCPDGGGNFSDMANAMISLFAITLGFYQGDFRDMQEDPVLLLCIFTFLTFSVILLLNLLIAQLNRTYEFIYQDMLGYAQLNLTSLIVNGMEGVSKKTWVGFVKGLKLNEKREFDEGDLGLAGCIQVMEPASKYRQSVEMIIRYGGTTARNVPWPEETVTKTADPYDILESTLRKILQRQNMYSDSNSAAGASRSIGASRGTTVSRLHSLSTLSSTLSSSVSDDEDDD